VPYCILLAHVASSSISNLRSAKIEHPIDLWIIGSLELHESDAKKRASATRLFESVCEILLHSILRLIVTNEGTEKPGGTTEIIVVVDVHRFLDKVPRRRTVQAVGPSSSVTVHEFSLSHAFKLVASKARIPHASNHILKTVVSYTCDDVVDGIE